MSDTGGTVDYPPQTICAICGHIRNLHETIERQRCGACQSGGRSGLHLFVPVEPAQSGQP